jgi:hypothetical protein
MVVTRLAASHAAKGDEASLVSTDTWLALKIVDPYDSASTVSKRPDFRAWAIIVNYGLL